MPEWYVWKWEEELVGEERETESNVCVCEREVEREREGGREGGRER